MTLACTPIVFIVFGYQKYNLELILDLLISNVVKNKQDFFKKAFVEELLLCFSDSGNEQKVCHPERNCKNASTSNAKIQVQSNRISLKQLNKYWNSLAAF